MAREQGGGGQGSRPDLRKPIRLLTLRYPAEPPHGARHVAGIGANQEPVVAEPGQWTQQQPDPGFVPGDHFTGVQPSVRSPAR